MPVVTEESMGAPRRAIISIYKQQKQFRLSNCWIRGLVGGRGTGKSTIGALDIIRRAKAGQSYMAVSPSYGVMEETTWPIFQSLAEELGVWIRGIKSPLPKARFRTSDGGVAEVVFRSGEKPEKLRGPSKAGLWLDEPSIMPKAVFDIGMPVLRDRGKMGWLSMTFTPKGRRHWTYEVFFERKGAIDIPKRNTELIHARSVDNPFLPPEFVDLIRDQYTSAMAAQELEGLFVDLEGLLFKREWFGLVDFAPVKADRIRYWDKACTPGGGAYTAGVLMARTKDGMFYVEDVVRGQWSPQDRDRIILQTAASDARRYDNQVYIFVEQEGGSGGKEAAQQTVRMLAGYPVRRDVVGRGRRERVVAGEKFPGDAKIVRAQPFASQCEAGNVRLLRRKWCDDFLDELCLAKGSQITTIDGEVPIESIRPGMLVLTRRGWRPVLIARCTDRSAVTWTLSLSNGRKLTGTPNHPLWVSGYGWKRIERVQVGDELLPPIAAFDSISIPNPKSGISRVGSTTAIRNCTFSFGKRKLVTSRTGGTSTMTTETQQTTLSTISAVFQQPSICGCTLQPAKCRERIQSAPSALSVELITSQIRGLDQKRVQGRARTNYSINAGTNTFIIDHASVAERSSLAPISGRSIAGKAALELRTAKSEGFRKSPVHIAERCSSQRCLLESAVATVAVQATAIDSEESAVYCLQVEGEPEYFANGVLVHNCAFPDSKYADQVDAASAAFNKLVILFAATGRMEGSRAAVDKVDAHERYGVQVAPDSSQESGRAEGWKKREGWFKK